MVGLAGFHAVGLRVELGEMGDVGYGRAAAGAAAIGGRLGS